MRDLAAVYAHVERAVADPERRVRLEGDIAAVRRVANPLQVGMAAETHFLFGDDRFARGARSSSGPRPATACSPRTRSPWAQIRGWIDAIRPELGLRDEVADLIVLAWAALRQRAWYQHGSLDPGAAARRGPPGHAAAARAAARPRRLAGRDVARRGAVRHPGQPVPDRGRRRRAHRGPSEPSWTLVADPAAGLVPRVELAYRHLGLPDDRPGRLATARAGASAWSRPCAGPAAGCAWSRPWPGPQLPATDTAVGELAAAGRGRRLGGWTRSGGTGSRPLRAAEDQDDERGRAAARHADGRCGRRSRRTSSRPGSAAALSAADDAIFDWLSAGQRATPVPLRRSRGPDDVPIYVPPSPLPPGRSGRATRAKGAPASEVLGPLRAFLDAHRDDAGGGRMAGAGVTVMATRATLPVLRALLDQARRKNYSSGVLGVRARPEWPGARGRSRTPSVPVRVVPCVSALAVREALLERADGQWLVVLTDRADDDLGAGRAQPPGVAPAAHPGPVGRGPAALRRHRGRARADHARPRTGTSPPAC